MALRILDLAARLLLALGVGCLLLAGYLAWRTLSFSGDAIPVTGEVVSYREIPDGDSTRYVPRIRFVTAAGDIVTVGGQLAGTSRRFPIGAKVPMVYDPSEPMHARVALFMDNWLGPCIAAVVGLVGFAGGLLVRRSVRRELAKTRA
jgi:Protein of unknown function (DUF3592)